MDSYCEGNNQEMREKVPKVNTKWSGKAFEKFTVDHGPGVREQMGSMIIGKSSLGRDNKC